MPRAVSAAGRQGGGVKDIARQRQGDARGAEQAGVACVFLEGAAKDLLDLENCVFAP